MPDVKIFVSHRVDLDSVAVENSVYIPVRCGAELDTNENPTMIGDNTGENISDKREYLGVEKCPGRLLRTLSLSLLSLLFGGAV